MLAGLSLVEGGVSVSEILLSDFRSELARTIDVGVFRRSPEVIE